MRRRRDNSFKSCLAGTKIKSMSLSCQNKNDNDLCNAIFFKQVVLVRTRCGYMAVVQMDLVPEG
jgi:hypothetical protein